MDYSGADLTYLVAGLTLVLALIVPTLVKRVAVSSPIVLLVVGLALGLTPLTDGLPIDPRENRAVIEHVTELAVLVALMGVGLAIDRPLRLLDATSLRTWSPTWRLLAITMPLSIAGVAALGLAAGLSLSLAVLLGAALAPTDPVLASDVQVAGPNLEAGEEEKSDHEERSEVRFALTSEAGLNDGLAFPFVYAAILLAAGGSTWSRALEWVGFHLVLRVLIGVVTGIAIGIALDPAVCRVGGRGVYPRQFQRTAVHPGAVAVGVGQERRTIGHGTVEVGGARVAPIEGSHRPASAQDPLVPGVCAGVLRDARQVACLAGFAREVAADHVEPAPHGVHVGVLKARQQHASGKVDDLGLRADQLAHLTMPDGNDAVARHRDGRGPAANGVCGENRSAGEDEVSLRHRRHC